MRIAAIQMRSGPDAAASLTQARALIEQAADAGAQLIGLPECFPLLASTEDLRRNGAIAGRDGEALLRESARERGLHVFGGILEDAPDGRLFNTLVLFGPGGTQLARYRKMHLFDVDIPDGVRYRESDSMAPGPPDPCAVPLQLPGAWIAGLSICYDVRFPELYRKLVCESGANLLLVPAAFTAFTGRSHWMPLLQARAIENTSFLLAPAQAGNHYGKRVSHGHALVLDPWGELLADAGPDEPGFALAELDPERLQETRNRIPSLEHRRLL